MKHFARIATAIDTRAIRAALACNPDLWSIDTRRQDRIPEQRHTQAIHLRYPLRTPSTQHLETQNIHPSELGPHAWRIPEAVLLCGTLANRLGTELGRAMIVRLVPGGKVAIHRDTGEYYAARDRYHLVLENQPGGSLVTVADETVEMQPGELWWFDNKAPHSAQNSSPANRVHIIFDVLATASAPQPIHPAVPAPPVPGGSPPDGLASPTIADLADRLRLDSRATPLGRPHPDELKTPERLRILPDVEIHAAPSHGLQAIRNGRCLPLGDTAKMRRVVEHLSASGATGAEITESSLDPIVSKIIAAWLVRNGIAGRADATDSPHRIWLKAGATPYGAANAIQHAPTFNTHGLPLPVVAILRAMQLRLAPNAPTQIQILTEGFSPTALTALQEAKRLGCTTIPVFRSHPGRLLIGPWLTPDGQPCPHCWYSTLIEAASRPDLTLPLDPSTAPDSLPDALALYVAKHLIGLDRRRLVFALGVRNGALTKHPVIPDPACPHCGEYRSTPPARAKPPIDVTNLPGLRDPVTGATGPPHTPQTPVNTPPALRAFHVAFASWVRRGSDLNHRELAAGKGRSPEGARAGALAEALERRSLSSTPSHLLRSSRPRGHPDIEDTILETQDVDLYGPEQRPGHADGTSTHPHNRRIPATNPRETRPLIQLRRLRGSPGPWIETARVFGLAEADRAYPAARCSNGVAAGPTLEEAIFRGFAELVERDAAALWWYSMCRRPAIPLDAIGPTREHALLAARGLRTLGRDLTILDLATNRVLPTVAAVSFQGPTRPMIGLGAGATHAIAASRAIAEIWQNLNLKTGQNRLANRDPFRRAIDRLDRRTAAWLTPHGLERDLVDRPAAEEPIDLVERASNQLDVSVFWIELTDQRLPLPVARAFAPGLRHFWRRTAPGRLFQEPYRLRWTQRPLRLPDLNRLELLI